MHGPICAQHRTTEPDQTLEREETIMTTITAAQHTALLAAIYALAEKELTARERGDWATAHAIGEQWNNLRILADDLTADE